MAFLPLIPLIIEGTEAAVATTEVVGTAAEVTGTVAEAGSTIAETGSTIAEAGSTTVETGSTTAETGSTAAEAGSTAAEGGGTASRAVPVFDMTASGTTAGANAAHQAIVDGIVSFSKWTAQEIVKNAIFYGGMKAAEALFHAVAASNPNDPAATAMSDKVTRTSSAASGLHTTTDDWTNWLTSHYNDRESYGKVDLKIGNPPTAFTMTRFEILQYNIGALNDWLGAEVAPKLLAFNNSKTAADLDLLRAALITYCQKVKAQSDAIVQNEQAMVKAGLQAHQDDIAKALTSLSS